jgi:nucleotidyltransferase substrate binding protein (TIGR01987 family)
MNDIYNSFKKSIVRLDEILRQEKTVANRDSAIKRFEFTFELAWKSLQHFLREEGIPCRSPKECLKEAFEFELIGDDYRWLEMVEDRNLTVHTYDENIADDVFKRLPSYLGLFRILIAKLEAR